LEKYNSIPDASVLLQERGLFWYAEGPEGCRHIHLWIDNFIVWYQGLVVTT
jgi:hypothetical protein